MGKCGRDSVILEEIISLTRRMTLLVALNCVSIILYFRKAEVLRDGRLQKDGNRALPPTLALTEILEAS